MVIDWEFTRIGDPREDIGYYSSNPLPRNFYGADPQRFLNTTGADGAVGIRGEPRGHRLLLHARDGPVLRADDGRCCSYCRRS